MIIPNIWKNKKMFQTTNQVVIKYQYQFLSYPNDISIKSEAPKEMIYTCPFLCSNPNIFGKVLGKL